MKNVIQIIAILFVISLSKIAVAQISFGVFADCQYCDCETSNTRFYRNSLQKLENAVAHFNQNKNLEFVVNLGDLIDRDFASFSPLKPILQKLNKPVYHLPGNHDFEVEPHHLEKVPEELGLSAMYYSMVKKDWMFVFLDGTEISVFSGNKENVKLAEKMSAKLKAEGKPNYYIWNGGIGKQQLNWFNNQLKEATAKNLNVAVFCHYPLLPFESHALWNQAEVLEILNNYSCVKLWLNGHNHAGNYTFQNRIHFITLKGMVETETENAFGEVILNDKIIEIRGLGREPHRILHLK
ncbi:MAG: metallophosphoesterase [Mariniphaga sp.]|jgi:predicted MPP superfamily phosphohydrolase|nr:metallophosphoesterase [Mariniphaga sp.]